MVESKPESEGKSVQPQAPDQFYGSSEPESKYKSVQPQAPDQSKGSEETVLNQETGASFIGVPAGEEGSECDKVRDQLLLMCGDERNVPKNLKDGSSRDLSRLSLLGTPMKDVVDFVDKAEGQLKYVPGHLWHVCALNTALGPKAYKMADVHQKGRTAFCRAVHP